MSPQDRIFVPSFQHRAWLGSTSLSPQMEEEESVKYAGPVSLPRDSERVGHLPEVTQLLRAEPGLEPRTDWVQSLCSLDNTRL